MTKASCDLLRLVKSGEGMARLAQLYGRREGEMALQMERYTLLIKQFEETFDAGACPVVISAPGRSEICGNHTDHNNGVVLAAAINLDTIAAVRARKDHLVTLFSEGFDPIRLDLSDVKPVPGEEGTPAAIIRGTAARLREMGMDVRGFDGAATSSVLSGSGLSSSASFELMVVTAFDALFGGMRLTPIQRAQVAQYAENHYFGKPCGLMDQMASSCGGLVYIDFKGEPAVTPLAYDFAQAGYTLAVVNTGGAHDDLTREYAAIREEMNAVAACFGEKTLRRVRPEQLWQELPRVRALTSDRAALRAAHFYAENDRVRALVKALQTNDMPAFLRLIIASGESSWMHLQNVYARNDRQPLCLALAASEHMLSGRGAWRMHGGGFAGTTLNFVPSAMEEPFAKAMNALFGERACLLLNVRAEGATIVFDAK